MANTHIAPASPLVCDDWQIAESDAFKPASLIVQGRQRTWTFPWFRYVWAEGTASEIKITFVTHMVTITGYGLTVLWAGVADQRIIRVTQPSENEAKFAVRGPNSTKHSGAFHYRHFCSDVREIGIVCKPAYIDMQTRC